MICLTLLLTELKASKICDCEDSDRESLYEQYCCHFYNKGKTFTVSGEGQSRTHILCPPETPASCSKNSFLSCMDALTNYPNTTSGYYKIDQPDGSTASVYCDMEGVNCDGEGGWVRVAYLNMSDPTEVCPTGFRLYEVNDTRACGRQSGPGCQSVEFPTYNISYSQVCGRVNGYQKGSTDALAINLNDIDQTYVDGISITTGYPRRHIWTFISALQENSFNSDGQQECPCAPNSPVTTPWFVGNDYFCESGSPSNWQYSFYDEDVLWDGKQCGLIEEACCNVTSIPWFHKTLYQPTTEYIELRVCSDENINLEDIPYSFYEIYVK